MKNHKCPRCSGQLYIDSLDEFDEEYCLNCGYVQYIHDNLKKEKYYSSSCHVEYSIDNYKYEKYDNCCDRVKNSTNESTVNQNIFRLILN